MIFVIVSYLLLWALANLVGIAVLLTQNISLLDPYKTGILCALSGGLGGFLYCWRAMYLNVCVYKRWDSQWHIWYFQRPVASIACGAVSYLFLKAGLLVLESSSQTSASDLGFYAFAFIAGYNVDKFLQKLEDVAASVWGIENSRAVDGAKDGKEKS